MKPPTPAMIRALRHIKWRVDEARFLCIGYFCHPNTIKALRSRGLIWERTLPSGWRRMEPTDAGRRVLAEHTTTGDE